jgi:hypothetical protein
MANAEPLRQFTDGRSLFCGRPLGRKPFDRQQRLMLARGQPGALRRRLAELQKPADQIAKIGKCPVARAVECGRLSVRSGEAPIGDAASPSTCG